MLFDWELHRERGNKGMYLYNAITSLLNQTCCAQRTAVDSGSITIIMSIIVGQRSESKLQGKEQQYRG